MVQRVQREVFWYKTHRKIFFKDKNYINFTLHQSINNCVKSQGTGSTFPTNSISAMIELIEWIESIESIQSATTISHVQNAVLIILIYIY